MSNKAKAFFILNDGDVVEEKVAEVIHKVFFDPANPNTASNCTQLFAKMLDDDRRTRDNLTYFLASLVKDNELRGYNPFISVLSEMIYKHVENAMMQAMPEVMERRMKELREMERRAQYKGFFK